MYYYSIYDSIIYKMIDYCYYNAILDKRYKIPKYKDRKTTWFIATKKLTLRRLTDDKYDYHVYPQNKKYILEFLQEGRKNL